MERSNFIRWAVLALSIAGMLSVLLASIHRATKRKGAPSFLRSSMFMQWSALGAIFGGLLFIAFEFLYVFTHGTTSVPRNATVFGLTNLQYYRMSIVWQLLILFALLGTYARWRRAGLLGETGSVLALLSFTMLVVSTILQVYVVDPSEYFFSFPVQSGWMLQLLSYPVYAVGMVLLGIGAIRSRELRWWSVVAVTNGLLPLLSLLLKPQLMWLLLFPLATYRPDLTSSEVMRDIASGATSVPFGLSWILLVVLLCGRTSRNVY